MQNQIPVSKCYWLSGNTHSAVKRASKTANFSRVSKAHLAVLDVRKKIKQNKHPIRWNESPEAHHADFRYWKKLSELISTQIECNYLQLAETGLMLWQLPFLKSQFNWNIHSNVWNNLQDLSSKRKLQKTQDTIKKN